MRSLKSSPILHTHTQKKESWKRATDCLVSTGLCWDRRCVDPFGKPRLLTTIPPLASPTSALFPLEGLSGGALLWNPEWHFKVLSVSWDQVCISITGAVLLMTSHLDFGDLESYKGRDSNCWIVTSGRKETWEEKKKWRQWVAFDLLSTPYGFSPTFILRGLLLSLLAHVAHFCTITISFLMCNI